MTVAAETMSIKFVGDDGSLQKTLGSLQAQLKRFTDGLKNADNVQSFNRIQRAIDATKSRIDTLSRGNVLQPLKKGTDEATQSLINLSRVAQDAPYGFMGIANNLNPLLESFQRLRSETGGNKAAFQALTSQLMGPAGIGLALGVVSSLLVKFGGDMFSAKSEADLLTEAIKDIGDAAQDSMRDIDDFKDAIQFANQFEGLRTKIANFGQIGEGNIQALEAERQRNQELKERVKLQQDLNRARIEELTRREVDAPFGSDQLKAVQEALKKANDVQQDLFKQESEASKAIGLIGQQINYARLQNSKDTADKLKAQAEKEAAERKKRNAEEARLLAESYQNHLEYLEGVRMLYLDTSFGDQQGRKEDVFAVPPKVKPEIDPSFDRFFRDKLENIEIKPRMQFDFSGASRDWIKGFTDMLEDDAFKKQLEDMKKSVKSFGEYLSATLGDAFASVFDALMEGEDPLKAFLNSIKQTVKQLAADLIATYIRVAVFKALASPGSAAAGGGGLFSSLLGALTGFNQGGLVPGSGNTDTVPAMLTPGELVIPKNIVQQMRAGDLSGVARLMNQTQNARTASGMASASASPVGMEVHVSGSLTGHGDKIVALIDQRIKAQRRAF